MIDVAADVLAIARAKTKNKFLLLSMYVANKDGTHHMVKIIAC